MAPQNLFHCYYFDHFFVSETVFARLAMGFNGFFSPFCQVAGTLAGSYHDSYRKDVHLNLCETQP